jgi:hypothetical protein
MSLSRQLEDGGVGHLQAALANGPLPPASPGFMTVWCHGSPGIAMVRAHFLQATGATRWRSSLELASQSTLASLRNQRNVSHCLCHGLFGNIDALLIAGKALRNEGLIEAAHQAVAEALEKQHRAPAAWCSGNRHGAPTPGLLLGDSGVGLFFLRLAAPDVPSPLLPVTNAPPAAIVNEDRVYRAAVTHAAMRHFPRTQRAMERAGLMVDGVETSDPVADLQRLAAAAAPEDTNLLREVIGLEGEAFSRLRDRRTVADAYCQSIMRRPAGILSHPGTQLRLSDRARLIATTHDWDATLRPGAPLDHPPSRPTTYLLYETDGTFRLQALPLVAASIYRSLQSPATVAMVTDAVLSQLVEAGTLSSVHDSAADLTRTKVADAIRKAYEAEIVDIVEPAITTDDIDGELCMRCGACCHIRIYVPGDATYAAFLKEMLEEPLRTTYPDAKVEFLAEGAGQIVLDLGDCRHLQRTPGAQGETVHCTIYGRRPEVCEEFNCVSWWRLQRLRSDAPTASDRLIRRVIALKS